MKLLLAVISLFFLTNTAFATPPLTAERIAYCKVNKNRIMIFEFNGLPSNEDMTGYLEKSQPMHTDGRMTAAYFFSKGSKTPQVSFSSCSSIGQANKLLYETLDIDLWEFAYMAHPNGKKIFVSCLENSRHELCRK